MSETSSTSSRVPPVRHWSDNFWAFCSAWIFLTRLPAPTIPRFDEHIVGRSLYTYPWIGALLGGGLLALALILSQTSLPALLSAIILVALWTWLTGALHLDGLADTADALAAAHGQPDRALIVMKDPNVGAIGATVIMLQLLLKVGLTYALLDWLNSQSVIADTHHAAVNGAGLFVVVLVLARLSPHLHLCWGYYLSSDGLGRFLVAYARLWPLLILLKMIALSVFLIGVWLGFDIKQIAVPLAVLVASWWLVNALWQFKCRRQLGGHTGDTLGAAIEINETSLLLMLNMLTYSF